MHNARGLFALPVHCLTFFVFLSCKQLKDGVNWWTTSRISTTNLELLVWCKMLLLELLFWFKMLMVELTYCSFFFRLIVLVLSLCSWVASWAASLRLSDLHAFDVWNLWLLLDNGLFWNDLIASVVIMVWMLLGWNHCELKYLSAEMTLSRIHCVLKCLWAEILGQKWSTNKIGPLNKKWSTSSL